MICVDDMPVARFAAADRNTMPIMATNTATKPTRAPDASFPPSVRTAHTTDGITSRKTMTAAISTMISIMDEILSLDRMGTQAQESTIGWGGKACLPLTH